MYLNVVVIRSSVTTLPGSRNQTRYDENMNTFSNNDIPLLIPEAEPPMRTPESQNLMNAISEQKIEVVSDNNPEFTVRQIEEIHEPWPTRVHCDMIIDAWQDALVEFKLLDSFGYLLKGFIEGFHQGIPPHSVSDLRWFCPPNHQSVFQVRDKIEKNIQKEIAAGWMFGPFEKELVYEKLGFFRTSPLGAVENGDGSFRPINDLSFPRNDQAIPSVNSFVNKNDFETTWDDFKIVATFFKNLIGNYLIGIFDWESAYRQIPTHPSQWAYLAICGFDDLIYIDTRIAFGGVAGCGSFGGPADGWKRIMESKFKLVKIFRWVDDNLCIKRVAETTTMLDIVRASEQLGVKTNVTKYSEFAVEQSFIGFVWNLQTKSVGLSAEKLLKRRSELDQFWIKISWTKNELETINGKLNHLTLILPQLKPYLTANFRWLASWTRPMKRKAPLDVLNDMLFWRTTLTSLKPMRLIPDLVEWNVGWVGDASTEFGIGVIVGRYWGQFRWKDGWRSPVNKPPRSIAWAETATVRLGLLMVAMVHDVAGRKLSCLSDNTTTNGAAKNLRSRDFWVNEEWKLIQTLLIRLDCDMALHYVKSKDNEADLLSRGADPTKKRPFCLKVDIPLDLVDLLEQVFP